MYKPLTLPALPRAKCPYEVLTADQRANAAMMKSKPCNQPSGLYGWCSEHAYVAEILELASAVGCPELVVETVQVRNGKEEPCLFVLRGLACWEEYAVRHPKRRHEALKRKMRVLLASQKGMYAA